MTASFFLCPPIPRFGAPDGPSVGIDTPPTFGTGIMDGAPLGGNRRRLEGSRWRLEGNRWRLEGDRSHSILSV